MNTKVSIENFDQDVALEICNDLKKGSISAEFKNCHKVSGFLTGLETLGMVGVFCSIIRTVIKLYEIYKESKWDYKKVQSVIQEELAKKGVVKFSMESVEGFQNLSSHSDNPCVITIKNQKNGDTYRLLIYRDKDVLVFKLNK